MSIARLAYLGVLMLALGSCWESAGSSSQLVELGPLSFEVPADWQRNDGARPGASTSIWTPTSNGRKESMTVMRSDRPGAGGSGTPSVATLQQQLVSAQRSLPDAQITRVVPVTTARGFAGSRLEVRYKPNNVDRTYRRVHVVLIESDATLIHVLYTAADPDEELGGLERVLDTLRHDRPQGGQS